MPVSYDEYYHGRTGLTVGVEEVLFSGQSPYQKVEVFETDAWGRLMTIDGMVMLSEKDEFVYHEMLSHVPLFTHPEPRRVLIIGGGDGGTAREVLHHPGVQLVDMVEIDEMVVKVAKEFLPGVGEWENPKLTVHFKDGTEFVKNIDTPYDVILVDGSDPVGPAKGLFQDNFLRACSEALTENGVLAAQTESPWIEKYNSAIADFYHSIEEFFSVSKMYLAYIPLYPAGMWSFILGSKGACPLDKASLKRVENGLQQFGSLLKYYNADVHKSCFALPNFVSDIID
ncbi:MAG TPA: polyamine aminopropyltransferase [Balneolaceae bacterium]|nr:polyamine aminopropyltransferase [Balneolaceae bacterium]